MRICLNCMKKYEDNLGECPHCGFGNWTYKPYDFCLELGVKLKNRYKLGTVIGAGGFGITYRAVDVQENKPVAIKEFYPSGMVSRGKDHKSVQLSVIGKEERYAKGLNNFMNEAKDLLVYQGNNNIVQVYDFFEQNGTAYIVMEYLRGKSLARYTADKGGKLQYDKAVEVMMSVLDALTAVHSKGMVHRDISPDNIFIQDDGQVKLIDFGAARESYGEEDKTMSIVLKPNYAPPEQFKKKSRQGPWTDIYALGATMFKVLTGDMPPESITRYMEDDLIRPSSLNPSVPSYFDQILYKVMALNIENRYQSAAQLKNDINYYRKGQSAQNRNMQGQAMMPGMTQASPNATYNQQVMRSQPVQTNNMQQMNSMGQRSAMPGMNMSQQQMQTSMYPSMQRTMQPTTQATTTKKSNVGVIVAIALSAVAVLAVIIILAVGSGKRNNDPSTTEATTAATTTTTEEATDDTRSSITTQEDTTEQITYATTEESTSVGESGGHSDDPYTNADVEWSFFIYDMGKYVTVHKNIFNYSFDNITCESTISYSATGDGGYIALIDDDIFTRLEIDEGADGKVDAVMLTSETYDQDQFKTMAEGMCAQYGDYVEYNNDYTIYLWETDDIAVTLSNKGDYYTVLYMAPDFWEDAKNSN